jgi:beta-ureidopropionase / N-carbamoyl-L-amino-acid hydrolase
MSAPGANLKINSERLWDSLMEMAKIGPGIAGGNNRQTVTDEDSQGRHLFQNWCLEAGGTMAVDEMGTMFARFEGTDPDALPVYIGSHLDTQPTGGKYDGVLGRAGRAGGDAVDPRSGRENAPPHCRDPTGRTRKGRVLPLPCWPAGVFAGDAQTATGLYRLTDAKGKRFGDELERIGWKGTENPLARARCIRFLSCTSNKGRSWRPRANKSASSPMVRACAGSNARSRARASTQGPRRCICAAMQGRGLARVTELVHEIAMQYQPNAVGAIGHIDVYPNSRNIIPEKVVFTIDVRSPTSRKFWTRWWPKLNWPARRGFVPISG